MKGVVFMSNDKRQVPQSSPQKPKPTTPSSRHDTAEEHRGYSLPPTSANPPMPPVKPPKSSD